MRMKIEKIAFIISMTLLLLWSCQDAPVLERLDLSKATYSGTGQCVNCHKAQEQILMQTPHWGKILRPNPYSWQKAGVSSDIHLGCEACHGPGSTHLEEMFKESPVKAVIQYGDYSPIPTSQQDEQCLECHQRQHTSWQASAHRQNDVSCAGCHYVCGKANPQIEKLLTATSQLDVCGRCHQDKRAAMERVSHHPLREGKMKCTSCHDPHGSGAESSVVSVGGDLHGHGTTASWVGVTVPDLCLKCHAEKRGPHLWEHPPILENCSNCHDPHGSIHEKLLTMKPPYLCQRCHSNPRHPSALYSDRTAFGGVDQTAAMFGRACLNCHPRIHGSNHPSGKYFQR